MAESIDLATLHITVVTREVKEGIASLDALAAAATRAETSVGKLAAATLSCSSAAKQIITQVQAVASAYKSLEAATAFLRSGFAGGGATAAGSLGGLGLNAPTLNSAGLSAGLTTLTAAMSEWRAAQSAAQAAVSQGGQAYAALGAGLNSGSGSSSGLGAGLGSLAGGVLAPIIAPLDTGAQSGISTGSGVGAAAGAAIGSIIPGLGTVLGGLIGGLAGGGLGGIFGSTGAEDKTPRGNIWSTSTIGAGYEGFVENMGSLGKKGFATSGWEEKIKASVQGIWAEYDAFMASIPDAMQASLASDIADMTLFLHTNKQNQGESLQAKYWNEANFQGWISGYQSDLYAAVGESMLSLDLADILPADMRPESIASALRSGVGMLSLSSKMGDKGADWQAGFAQRLRDALGQNDAGLDAGLGAGLDADLGAGLASVLASPDALGSMSADGLTRLSAALTAVDKLYTAAEALRHPVNEVAAQAQKAREELHGYADALHNAGLAESYAKDALEEYRQATIDSYIKSFNTLTTPVSSLAQQLDSVADAVTGHANALRVMGAAEEQVMRVERQREAVLAASYDALLRSSRQDYAQRYAAVTGGDVEAVKAQSAYANELAQVEGTYGKGASWTLTLLEKAAALNREAYQGRTDWTSGSTEAAITAAGYSMSEWYARYGQAEGFSGPRDYYADTVALQKAEEAQRVLAQLQAQQQSLWQETRQRENDLLRQRLDAASTLKSAWESVLRGLSDTRYSLRVNDATGLGMQARLLAAQAQFDDLYARSLGGDSDAAAQLGGVGQELLALRKEASANADEYGVAFADIDRKLYDAQVCADRTLSQNATQVDLLTAQLGVGNMTNDLLAQQTSSIAARIAAAESTLAAALGALKTPAQSAYGSTSGGIGSASSSSSSSGGAVDYVRGDYDWMRNMAQKKADALNAGNTLAPGQTAGGPTGRGWTVESVVQAIRDAGMRDVYDWYERYGKLEGFATGGVTPANRPFWVGERGPELMMSPYQYGVLSNADSLRLADSLTPGDLARTLAVGGGLNGAVGGESARAEMAALREDNAALRRGMERLVAVVENMAAHARDGAESLQTIRNEGLQTREYTPPPPPIINFAEASA